MQMTLGMRQFLTKQVFSWVGAYGVFQPAPRQ